MGYKDKKDKKLVLYYDKNNTIENFMFYNLTSRRNPDGSTFETNEVRKIYILKDKNGVVKGEARFDNYSIFRGNETKRMYKSLFKLSLGDAVDEQYSLLAMSLDPYPLLYNYKITNTAGKSSFTNLKWDFTKTKRKLTFYRKSD